MTIPANLSLDLAFHEGGTVGSEYVSTPIPIDDHDLWDFVFHWPEVDLNLQVEVTRSWLVIFDDLMAGDFDKITNEELICIVTEIRRLHHTAIDLLTDRMFAGNEQILLPPVEIK